MKNDSGLFSNLLIGFGQPSVELFALLSLTSDINDVKKNIAKLASRPIRCPPSVCLCVFAIACSPWMTWPQDASGPPPPPPSAFAPLLPPPPSPIPYDCHCQTDCQDC